MIITRRSIVGGLIGLVAAPAIVRAASLMPVKAIVLPAPVHLYSFTQNGSYTGPVARIRSSLTGLEFDVFSGSDIYDRDRIVKLYDQAGNADCIGEASVSEVPKRLAIYNGRVETEPDYWKRGDY